MVCKQHEDQGEGHIREILKSGDQGEGALLRIGLEPHPSAEEPAGTDSQDDAPEAY